MQAPSLIELFIRPIDGAGVEYMVTGGLASIVYGHPRLTLDVDLVLRLTASEARAFSGLWPSNLYYCPPAEVILEERARPANGHFNVIHIDSAMRADVYFAGADEFQAWALQHRVFRPVEGEPVQFAPVEYVIANKLRYFQLGGSDRHLRDVARILEISGPDIDAPTLESWIARLDLASEWARARAYREPI